MSAAPGSRARDVTVAAAVGVVLVVVAALSALVVVHRISPHHAVADERSTVLAAAGQLAVDFTSIDYRHLSTEFAETEARATPTFRQQYLKTVPPLAPLYRKGKVVVTTSVDTAGITSMTGDAATVLVALNSVGSNAVSRGGGATSLYRMQVQLKRIGGTWLADNVQPL